MKPETTAVLNHTQAKLESISQELEAELISLVNGNYGLSKKYDNSGVHQIDIEFFEDGYRLVAYPMSANEQQMGVRPLLANYPDGVLSGYDYDLDYEIYGDDDNEDIEHFYRQQKDMFINWFIACWERMDKPDLLKPVYLMAHDNNERAYDLQNSKWVQR